MHIASIENLSKSFGARELFKDISFHISQGDKLALVAPNGTGKSSLLHIISGIDTPSSGSVWIHKDIKIIMMKQEAELDNNKNIWDNIFNTENKILQTIKKYEQLLQQNKEETSDFAEIFAEMNNLDAWDADVVVKEIIGKLKLSHLNQNIAQLSGGQKKRVALAQALIETQLYGGQCLLILDEPTNHLDIETIEWLENYLSTQKTTLLLVTHDRWFLETICNVIIEMDNKKIYRHEGNYDYYLEQKAHRYEVETSELQKDKNIFRKELEWMRKQPKARTTKSKSREDNFYKLKEKVSQKNNDLSITLDIKMNRLGGKVVEMKKVYKNIGNIQVLKGFDYNFAKGERIGVIGKNGVGKTTFLNIITGKVLADSGKINHGETVVFGYYSQDGLEYKENIRAIEYIKNMAEFFPLSDGTKISATMFMERFGFSAEQQYTFLDSLSGGEKRRLHLMAILFKNPNFLILDEPTNDLDLQTLRILEEFLQSFKGCLLIVSHDRYFMDRLVDHLFVLKGNGEVQDFPGNYSQYREWLDNEEKNKTVKEKNTTHPQQNPRKVRNQLSFNEKREFEQIEKILPELEKERKQLEDELLHINNYEQIQKNSQRIAEIIKLVEEKELRWLELSEKQGE